MSSEIPQAHRGDQALKPIMEPRSVPPKAGVLVFPSSDRSPQPSEDSPTEQNKEPTKKMDPIEAVKNLQTLISSGAVDLINPENFKGSKISMLMLMGARFDAYTVLADQQRQRGIKTKNPKLSAYFEKSRDKIIKERDDEQRDYMERTLGETPTLKPSNTYL